VDGRASYSVFFKPHVNKIRCKRLGYCSIARRQQWLKCWRRLMSHSSLASLPTETTYHSHTYQTDHAHNITHEQSSIIKNLLPRLRSLMRETLLYECCTETVMCVLSRVYTSATCFAATSCADEQHVARNKQHVALVQTRHY